MFKAISITVPKNMIQEIDQMLLKSDFGSRSEFFRHLVRMWFYIEGNCSKNLKLQPELVGGSKNNSCEKLEESADEKLKNADLEFGIPLDIIEVLKEKAKLLN